MRERIYVGIYGSRFRRERALFRRDRVGRIRWEAGGANAVQWLGARRGVPVLGDEEAVPEAMSSWFAEGEGDLLPIRFDPMVDRLIFMDDDGVRNSLSDTAALHYRYYSGDTLRVELPGRDRTIVMVEVRVQARRASDDLISGSLWFDDETAALVRIAYRPALHWDLEVNASGGPPGLLRPITGEIHYVAIEYGLHDFTWWSPGVSPSAWR